MPITLRKKELKQNSTAKNKANQTCRNPVRDYLKENKRSVA